MRSVVLVVAVGCGSVAKLPDASQASDGGPDATPPKPPTFVQPAKEFGTSYGQTGGLTIVDLNADGIPDIATFNPAVNSGLVTSFLSDGHGTLTAHDGTGSSSSAKAISGGLMGGTTMGTTTANASGVSLYHAGANGVLDYATNYNLTFPTQSVGQAVAMAPLDGGSKAWIVEGTDQMIVVSAPAAGTNYTTPGAQYVPNVSITALALAKVSGGTAPDIVAVGTEATGSNVYVLANNGSGAFGVPQKLPLPAAPTAVAVGNTHIIAATADHVFVFVNQGGGVFPQTPTHTYAAQPTITALALADFNGDGKLDIAASCKGADQVAIFTGNGDGSFNAPVVFAAGQVVEGIGVADFNGDTKPDIVVSGFFGIYLLTNTTM